MTYKDLYHFIQTAEVSESGFHNIDSDRALHIYNHKHQVNVNVRDNYGELTSICNIVFNGDFAVIYKIENGICDYGELVRFDINDEIAAISYRNGLVARNIIYTALNNAA